MILWHAITCTIQGGQLILGGWITRICQCFKKGDGFFIVALSNGRPNFFKLVSIGGRVCEQEGKYKKIIVQYA